MIFLSGNLRDDRVWQKASANTRTFDNWVETKRSVWNMLSVFQGTGFVGVAALQVSDSGM